MQREGECRLPGARARTAGQFPVDGAAGDLWHKSLRGPASVAAVHNLLIAPAHDSRTILLVNSDAAEGGVPGSPIEQEECHEKESLQDGDGRVDWRGG